MKRKLWIILTLAALIALLCCGTVQAIMFDPDDNTCQYGGAHTWGEWSTDKEATCTEDGKRSRSCNICLYFQEQTIPALGHNFQETITRAPNCTEEGWAIEVCTRCEAVKDNGHAVSALGHAWDGGVVTTAATCTQEGVKTYTCTRDGSHTYTEPIARAAHTPVTIPAVAATCTAGGKTEGSKCSVCGTILTAQQDTAALGHAWDSGTVTTAATCTQDGVKTFTCTRCGATSTETIAKTGHTPVSIPAVAATCTAGGKTEGSKCSVCGTVLTAQQDTAALGHAWDGGVVTTAATCTQDGVKTFTCTRCGTTYTETIAKTNHTPVSIPAVAATCTAGGKTEGSKCSVCGTILTAQQDTAALGHAWDSGTVTTAPTCTAEGIRTFTCTRCGATRTEAIAKTNHAPVSIPAVAATCTAGGKTEGSKCSVCGTILTAQQDTAALGHSPVSIPAVAATCTAGGKTEGSKCSVCGTVLTAQQDTAALGHSWDGGAVTTAATCTQDGVKTFTCTRCGATTTETILKTGHTPVSIPAVAATCTAGGKTEGSQCSVCGTVLTAQQDTAALGHSWDGGAVTTAATCTQDGVRTSTCTRCGATYTETIAKAAHTPVSIPAVAATCSAGGKTEGSQCSVCGTILTAQQDTAALGHSWDGGVVTTAVSCTQDGVKTFTCTRCGATYIDTIAKLAHTPVSIPAVAATCTAGGKTEGSQCSVCGTVLTAQQDTAALGHHWGEGVQNIAPGYLTPGQTVYTCDRCGETKTEEIPAQEGGKESVFDALSGWNPNAYTKGIGEEAWGSISDILGSSEPDGTPLRIVQQPTGGTYANSDTFTLTVKAAGGDPYYSYQWYMSTNDETKSALSALTNLILWLLGSDTTVLPEDVGDMAMITEGANTPTVTAQGTATYYCVVTDEAGDSVTSEKVRVTKQLYIREQSRGCKRDGSLSVSVGGGLPPYTYHWEYFDAGHWHTWSTEQTANKIDLPGDHSFICTITDAEGDTITSDKMKYCYVKNHIKISVPTKPNPVGETITIKAYNVYCDATVQWMKDGKPYGEPETVPGGRYTHNIESKFQCMEEGTYQCMVSDPGESIVSKECIFRKDTLDVDAAPSHIDYLEENDTVHIWGSSKNGTGPFTYQWQYKTHSNGVYEDIPDASGTFTEKYSPQQIRIHKPGFYRINVTDAFGNTGFDDLTAEGMRLKFMEQPKGGMVSDEDGTFSFTAIVDNGQPPFYYALYRKTKLGNDFTDWIENSDSRKCSFTVNIPGDYFIEVTDALNFTGKSDSFSVTEPTPLTLIDYTRGASVSSENDIELLKVRVSGGKEPYTVQWYRVNSPYAPDDPRYTFTGEYEEMTDLNSQDKNDTTYIVNVGMGVYRCIVTDAAGAEVVTNNIVVGYSGKEPVITTHPENVSVPFTLNRFEAVLTCEAFAAEDHRLYYMWYKKQDNGWYPAGEGFGKTKLYLTEDIHTPAEKQICTEYYCLVSDWETGQSVKSREARVSMEGPVARVEQVGTDTTLILTIEGGNGPYQVTDVRRIRDKIEYQNNSTFIAAGFVMFVVYDYVAEGATRVTDDLTGTWFSTRASWDREAHSTVITISDIERYARDLDKEETYDKWLGFKKCYKKQPWTYIFKIKDSNGNQTECSVKCIH